MLVPFGPWLLPSDREVVALIVRLLRGVIVTGGNDCRIENDGGLKLWVEGWLLVVAHACALGMVWLQQ